jgi:ABC-type phosphate transport system substrate-binding protein
MRALPATVLTLSLALTALAATVSAEQAAQAPHYRIIVHPRNPVTSVDRKFLEDAFLKKATRWPNQRVIHPTDLAPRSSARSRFSREVLDRSVAAVKAYWQQRIFSGGDVPPPEFDSDEKVVAYVLKYDGAVGYVSGAANLRGAKALAVSR